MKKTAALLAAALATACGQTEVADRFRDAMPSHQEVQVGAPTAGQGATGDVQGPTASRVGSVAPANRSEYAATSYQFAASVNTAVALTLLRLEAVTFWRPTSCTELACTWGPGAEAGEVNEYRLVVTRAGEAYDYALQGRPKGAGDAAWVSVVSGRAYPGLEPHRGHGTMLVDFDGAWAGLAPGVNPDGTPRVQQDFGRVEFAYDARTELKVQAAFVGAKDADKVRAGDPSARLDAWYDFAATGSGGSLHLAFQTKPAAAEETVSLHTRWSAAGNGRGDAVAQSYLYPGVTYHASECWAGAADAYLLTYDTDPAFGSEGACTGFLTADELAFPAPFPPAP
jgi:hypothetical protein